MNNMKLILASASPRRRELLGRLGLDFAVCPSDAEEKITKTEPAEVVMELAAQKAMAVAATFEKEENLLFLGADTIVVQAGAILGKPKDEEVAFRMLTALSGATLQVYTGVCLLERCKEAERSHCFFEKTDVTFYPMTEEEIWAYIETKDPFDKAGAYGIQGPCGKHIAAIKGDYNNVVGLRIVRLYQVMKQCMTNSV